MELRLRREVRLPKEFDLLNAGGGGTRRMM
jgi:hypothetical protein